MRSLGIDLASLKTGIVILEANGTPTPSLVLEKIVTYPKLEGIVRHKAVVEEIMGLLHAHLRPKDDVIVIEGYSLNTKHASSLIPLVEVGSILRLMLVLDGLTWLDPRAGQVKEFVTGKGNSPKDMVVAHVLKRWGHMAKDNNTADAYALSCMGLARSNGLPGITARMREIAGEIVRKTK